MLWIGVRNTTGTEKKCEESIRLLCRVLFFVRILKMRLKKDEVFDVVEV